MNTLGNQIENCKNNNLNAIRLMLALAVILSHSFPLSLGLGGEARGEPLASFTHQQEAFGSVAVNLFFFISGMLITASWLRSKTMSDFLMKRVLRIYPAFITAIGFSGVLIWIFCPEFRAGVGHGIHWSLSLLKDSVFLTYNSLAWHGIFSGNPFPNTANGSLWTIPIEFLCYLLVAIIGLFCLFKHRLLVLLALLVFFLAYSKSLFDGADTHFLDRRFLTYFLLGTSVWLWRDKIPFSKWLALGCVVVLLVASQFKPWFAVLFPILGGYCTLWVGYGLKINFLNWTEKTDLSYGTYLYAFPVQQMVAMSSSLRCPWINFLVATPPHFVAGMVELAFGGKAISRHEEHSPQGF